MFFFGSKYYFFGSEYILKALICFLMNFHLSQWTQRVFLLLLFFFISILIHRVLLVFLNIVYMVKIHIRKLLINLKGNTNISNQENSNYKLKLLTPPYEYFQLPYLKLSELLCFVLYWDIHLFANNNVPVNVLKNLLQLQLDVSSHFLLCSRLSHLQGNHFFKDFDFLFLEFTFCQN